MLKLVDDDIISILKDILVNILLKLKNYLSIVIYSFYLKKVLHVYAHGGFM